MRRSGKRRPSTLAFTVPAARAQSYECFPDIPFEQVMDALFRKKGICTEGLGQNAAQLFRIASMEHLRLYPHVLEALTALLCRL